VRLLHVSYSYKRSTQVIDVHVKDKYKISVFDLKIKVRDSRILDNVHPQTIFINKSGLF
jgi:hypothetical protein